MGTVRVPPNSDPERGLAIGICFRDLEIRERVDATLADEGYAVLVSAGGVEELLVGCNGSTPAGVVLGARRVDREVASAVAAVRSTMPATRVVLVCQRASEGDVRRALGFGADGVLLAERIEGALAAVVSVVVSGQVSVPADHRDEVGREVLTMREKQMLGLVVSGLTNAQIAAKLFLAESTVKSHLSSAFGKLNVSSRYEAVSVILDPDRGRSLGVLINPVEAEASLA